jgi:precorrin-6B C5,15-methyltransferase / cobalt-precorrin-6B C5,C15-methyltransferase
MTPTDEAAATSLYMRERGPGAVWVVGITDAGPASLPAETRTLVERAEVLCGGERHLAFFPDHPAERFTIRANVAELLSRLADERRTTVVLASGDPDCFGIGPLLAAELGMERVTIVPNLSTAQLAFARLGIAWQDAAIVSAHGRPLEAMLPVVLGAEKVAILTDSRNTPAVIARALLQAGDDAQADVFEHLGGARERHVAGRLADLVDQEFASLNVLIVRRERARPWPLGLADDLFAHRGGMITKAEVRAVSVAKLRLHERAVVWDVGAGCGSVAVEASGLARRGQVYAIERDPVQLAYLDENRRRFGAGNITVVAGAAPAALAELPDPDAIFIGGSGGELPAILAVGMTRLRAGGRIVANLATIEHLTALLETARAAAWTSEVVQIAVSRGTDIAGATRFAALNPIFIATLAPPVRAVTCLDDEIADAMSFALGMQYAEGDSG